ncbi:hypothetical protein CK203_024388 [Vitis vinifera]|uniref:Retrotransposon gag domain-containing protein n=1 Tax=Vitis vinifera TaxID=29760 RepID=A0A438IY72_VITVI|nr:hypothetical protein CK203_024388 [Vitis vinifera]
MPKWIRDIGGRLVKCDTPQKGEFEVILNIMEAAPEDQHSHQGRQDNLNEFRSMRDRMHPPRMSATIMYSAPYRVASDQTISCSTSTNFPWDGKYMEAINACPHHGFDTWLLVSYFYDGMSSSMKQLLETMCGGDFMSKNPEEAMDFLSYVADVSRGWDEPTKGEVGKMKSQLNAYNAKAGMYNLKEDDDMKAKLAAMTRRLEELELKRIHEVQAVAEAPVQVKLCPNCQSYEHLVEECPAISVERECIEIKQIATQYQQPDPPSQQSSSIEQIIANLSKVVGDFVGKQEATNARVDQRMDRMESVLNKRMDGMQNDMNQKFDNIQYSISRLTNLNTLQEKGRFPSQPNQNPKGVHEVESHEGESSQVKDVKALITLRSGKKIEQPTPKPHVEKEEEIKKGKEMEDKGSEISEEKKESDSTIKAIPEKELLKEEMLKKSTSPPFPQALHGKKGVRNAAEILEVLRQVKVNIPLLDMIKQVPTYAKFLKDLCTIKRGLTVNKKAFLTEQVSAILQCKSPLKYKDPGSPTISVMIGGKVVEKALLDLGASVNLLPYSVYKQLGLGELKPTAITLSLADRSVKIPRGVIEDVLVQVDNFYYPVDFIVLDTDPTVRKLI